MALQIIGKCAPLPKEIQRVVNDGFKKTELYTKENFLNNMYLRFVLDAKKRTGLKFYSIHTPHVKPRKFSEVLKKTKEFAMKAGIPIIVAHSMYVEVMSKKITDSLESNMFPENGYDHNLNFLEKVFKRKVKITLDTAHLHVASIRSGRDFYDDLETILTKYRKNVGHMHIADTGSKFFSRHNDENIGDGQIDWYTAMRIISDNYKGVAVVETGTIKQLRDFKRLKHALKFSPRKRILSKG